LDYYHLPKEIKVDDIIQIPRRPCKVVTINTFSTTDQYRYLGTDLSTQQLHEESSLTTNPEPGVVKQTILAPGMKYYLVQDLADGFATGLDKESNVKERIAVWEVSNLWTQIKRAFESNQSYAWVGALSDGNRKLIVAFDTKVREEKRGKVGGG
jgi:hypothetical protein